MNFSEISSAVERNAVPLVFVNVLMQQLGLPVPTVPTLLLAGSLALGPPPLGQALGAAMLASVLANAAWYGAGRAFGYRVLSGLRTSQTEPIAGAVVAEHDRLAQAVGDWRLAIGDWRLAIGPSIAPW